MKTKSRMLLLLILMQAGLLAQTVTVTKQYSLILPHDSMKAFYPVMNENGNKLLFTSDSYQGLSMYDFESKSITSISNEPGSGYEPIFNAYNSKVFYKNTSFQSGRKFESIKSYDFAEKTKTQMLGATRNLKQPKNFHNGFLVSTDKVLLKTTFGRTNKEVPVYVCSENLKMIIYRNGKGIELNPIGPEAGAYLWVSLSPDNKMILFTAARKGTFVCDLSGKILASLGKLNAPVWYDNDFVVGMLDVDDGQFITSSKIMFVSLNGKLKKQISPDNQIAMYPSACASKSEVVYNTIDGSIQMVELTVKK